VRKFAFDNNQIEGQQLKATSIRQSYLKQIEYKNGEDIVEVTHVIGIAASGGDNVDDNDMGGGNDLIIL